MNNLQLVEYVKGVYAKAANTVYILSGIGRPLTNDLINKRIAMGDSSAKKKESWLRTQVGKTAYDCVGLIKSFLWTGNKPFGPIKYVASQDQNVSMMWNASKERGTMKNEDHPDVPGLLVMTENLGHVGVYIGRENGRKTYIEATITDNTWRVIKSYGYVGRGAVQWTRWAKYSHITYVAAPAPKPDPKPNPKPTPSGKWIDEPGYQITLTTNIYERNLPDVNQPAGRVQRKKGEVIKVNAWQYAGGYVWRRQENGKAIPTGPEGKGQEWAKLSKVSTPAPKPNPTPDAKPTTPSKGKAKINPGAKYVSKSSKFNNVPVKPAYIGVDLDYELNRKGADASWVFFPSLTSYVDKKDVTFGGTTPKPTPPPVTKNEYGQNVKVGDVIKFSTLASSTTGGTINVATNPKQGVSSTYMSTVVNKDGKTVKCYQAKVGKIYAKSTGVLYMYELLTNNGAVLGRTSYQNTY